MFRGTVSYTVIWGREQSTEVLAALVEIAGSALAAFERNWLEAAGLGESFPSLMGMGASVFRSGGHFSLPPAASGW